jgi:phytoene dehydrogenase-like protein
LTLPGFIHDVCSAVYPFAAASPFFRSLQLEQHGLSFIQPPVPLAHPLDDGTAVVLERSVAETARNLDPADGEAYVRVMAPMVEDAEAVLQHTLAPLLRMPRHPLALARFGLLALRSTAGLISSRFGGTRARALLAGLGTHAILPLDQSPSAGFALVMALLGHAVGWPIARGGAQHVSNALASCLRALGGTSTAGMHVRTLSELPAADLVLLEVAPRGLLNLAGDSLPARYRRRLSRYRPGPGVFKVDWALDAPVPWSAEVCHRAGTLHLGGTFEEIADAERAVFREQHPERPFVLVVQQSRFDPTRAPDGKHTLYAYAHVPNGSTLDMTARIEAQVERFAPGFRQRILARSTRTPAQLERYNPTYVGGDILGGRNDLWQLIARPALRLVPYRTPLPGVYLCSSATPPGGGVHGLCGALAAEAALSDRARRRASGGLV